MLFERFAHSLLYTTYYILGVRITPSTYCNL
jgi:hypothetical protein